jgi:hypothetical protein
MTANVTDADLEDRLRRTLVAVAATVDTTQRHADPTCTLVRSHSQTGRRPARPRTVVGAAALGATTLLLAAGAILSSNPDVLTRMPDDILQRGSVDGDTWYMIPEPGTDMCGQQWPGVRVFFGSDNIINVDELGGGGMSYRAHDHETAGCVRAAGPEDLLDPTAVSIGFMNTEEDPTRGTWVGTIGVHPDITSLVVTSPGQVPQRLTTVAVPDDPTGPRYTVFTVPYGGRDYGVELRDAEGALVAKLTESLPYNPIQ